MKGKVIQIMGSNNKLYCLTDKGLIYYFYNNGWMQLTLSLDNGVSSFDNIKEEGYDDGRITISD